MEFGKNYSDDLLMGGGGANVQPQSSEGADLADFELPTLSGSSSGSEPNTKQQPSPTKRKSSTSTATQASSSQLAVSASPPDLTAVKNLLVSSYSKVSHVFHWRRPIESGVIFAIGATVIIALTFFSIISVVAYSALGVILTNGLIRAYKTLMKTLGRSQATPFDHIWDKALNLKVTISPDELHRLVDSSTANFNASLIFFKQVLLVEDKLATFKFGAFLYTLTYIGAWFNGLTILTISYLALFSVPIFYEQNKSKIDECLGLATSQVSSIISLVTSKISSATSSAIGGGGSKKQN